jgi:hypothetical protein
MRLGYNCKHRFAIASASDAGCRYLDLFSVVPYMQEVSELYTLIWQTMIWWVTRECALSLCNSSYRSSRCRCKSNSSYRSSNSRYNSRYNSNSSCRCSKDSRDRRMLSRGKRDGAGRSSRRPIS